MGTYQSGTAFLFHIFHILRPSRENLFHIRFLYTKYNFSAEVPVKHDLYVNPIFFIFCHACYNTG